MRHNLLIALALTAATGSTFLLAGCAADPILPDKAEEYSREFIKNFGVFDKTHDWNQATRVSVSVNTAKPTDIKIYAMVDGVRYLFSTYLNVNGQETLNVDVPKGTTDLIVRANGMDHEVKAGGAVDLTSRSRYIAGSETGPTTKDGLTWNITTPGTLRTVAAKTYISTYVEKDKTNLSKGTNSFYFIADGNYHTFYPFYWNTSGRHILGIFTVDPTNASNIKLHDLYYSKSGELTVSTDFRPSESIKHEAGKEQRLFTLRGTTNLPTDGHKKVTYNGEGKWEDVYFGGVTGGETKLVTISDPKAFTTPNGYISSILRMTYEDAVEYLFYETPTKTYEETFTYNEGSWSNAGEKPAYIAGEDVYVKTRGIQYKLNKGTRYGFYIKVKHSDQYPVNETTYDNPDYDYIIFSNAERNAVPFIHNGAIRNDKIYTCPWTNKEYWENTGASEKDKFAYASWGTARMLGREYTLFGFEDWAGADNDEGADLNDIMFLFAAGEHPSTVVDVKELGDTFEWIIACEDLGTDDFDFNDVVFGVSNPVTDNTTGKKTVDITALAAGGTLPVYLRYKDNVIGKEFHKWFGDNYSSSDVINAKTYSAQGMKYTIDVDEGFTLASGQLVDSDNMGGFKVEVQHSDGSAIISASNPKLDESIGSAPQMLCLPGTWLWPQENICIASVYNQFNNWCTDHNESIDWHKTPTTEDYVHRTISTGSGSGSLSDIGDASFSTSEEGIAPGQIIKGDFVAEQRFNEDTKIFKYTIPKSYIENATKVIIHINLLGASSAEIFGKNTTSFWEGSYNIKITTSPYKWELTTAQIERLKSDEAFTIYYYSYPDISKFEPEISIEATK